MDLFLRKVPKDKLHHNFKSIRNDESIKNVLQKWEEGFIDRDNKFVKEFQTTFNSSFWELYLNALLRSLNFNIDFSYNRPDFCVSKDGKEIVIEAVISNNPSNGIPEHDKISGMKDLMKIDIQEIENKYEEVIDLAVERILNSITNKHKLYIDKYRHLDHVKNKPFIIAIGAYEQPFFYLQAANAILKVLYGMDSARYEENVPVFKYKERILKKSNNSELNIGLFTDDRIKEVSAIIFSPIASIGKVRALADVKKNNCEVITQRLNVFGMEPSIETVKLIDHRESLQDGLQIYINPFAENKIDTGLFQHNDIAIYHDKEKVDINHNFLYARCIFGDRVNKNINAKSYRKLKLKKKNRKK